MRRREALAFNSPAFLGLEDDITGWWSPSGKRVVAKAMWIVSTVFRWFRSPEFAS
jgi:hypothetical protein